MGIKTKQLHCVLCTLSTLKSAQMLRRFLFSFSNFVVFLKKNIVSIFGEIKFKCIHAIATCIKYH